MRTTIFVLSRGLDGTGANHAVIAYAWDFLFGIYFDVISLCIAQDLTPLAFLLKSSPPSNVTCPGCGTQLIFTPKARNNTVNSKASKGGEALLYGGFLTVKSWLYAWS